MREEARKEHKKGRSVSLQELGWAITFFFQEKLKNKFKILEQYPYNGFALSGKYTGLRYWK